MRIIYIAQQNMQTERWTPTFHRGVPAKGATPVECTKQPRIFVVYARKRTTYGAFFFCFKPFWGVNGVQFGV